MHDPGTEFTGPEFQTLLQNYHIRDVCTTAKKSQSNAMCERMHQTAGNVLRILLHGNPLHNIADTAQYVNKALSIAHGGQDDLILSTIQAKSRSKSGHQRYSRQILQNRTTDSRRACAELVPKLLLRIPL